KHRLDSLLCSDCQEIHALVFEAGFDRRPFYMIRHVCDFQRALDVFATAVWGFAQHHQLARGGGDPPVIRLKTAVTWLDKLSNLSLREFSVEVNEFGSCLVPPENRGVGAMNLLQLLQTRFDGLRCCG